MSKGIRIRSIRVSEYIEQAADERPQAADYEAQEPGDRDGLYTGEEPEDYYAEPVQDGVFTRARAVALASSLAALLIILVAIVWLVSASQSSTPNVTYLSVPGAPSETAPRVGALAPDFTLIDVHTNQPVTLSSLRAKPVFINFWATWCPPCRLEMPEMEKIYNKYKDQIQIVGISFGPRDNPAGVKSFVDSYKYDWTFIHDPNYNVATAYNISAIPTSYFIDKSGVIRAINVGAMNFSQIENYLNQVR